MIPKIIHYIWFGKGKKNKLIENCINSWKKYCPDYKIIEWNEDNFDINSNQYVKEAYENKKWAFVSDYVRLYALYNEGGLYFDTDLEVLSNIDEFLNNNAFSGYELSNYIPTAIMGAEKGNEWIKLLLDYYDGRSFYNEDGSLDLTTNVKVISKLTSEKYNVNYDGKLINVEGVFKIYPADYFCPKNSETGELYLTENSCTIHHFNASWVDNYTLKLRNKKYKFIKKYGSELGIIKYNKWFKRNKLYIHIRLYGFKTVIKHIFDKIKNKIKGAR